MKPAPPSDDIIAAQRPTETLFNLLSIHRAGKGSPLRKLRQEINRRGLYYSSDRTRLLRLDFWQRLAQDAGLLDRADPPQPTLLAPEWLSSLAPDRLHLLLEAWMNPVSCSQTAYRERRLVISSLLQGAALPEYLYVWLRELEGMGLASRSELTSWGKALLLGQPAPHDPEPLPWRLGNGTLITPYPPDWRMLWELETVLWPEAPGTYPLSSLESAALSDAQRLLVTIETGLQHALPEWIHTGIGAGEGVQVHHGVVLVFEEASTLKRLRQSRTWRRELAHLLSSRHVLVEYAHARRVLDKLSAKGLLSPNALEMIVQDIGLDESTYTGPAGSRLRLDRADQSFLLVLANLARRAGAAPGLPAPPHGLEQRLARGLPRKLWESAMRRVEKILEAQQIAAQAYRAAGQTPAPASRPPANLLERLQLAIDQEETLSIRYHAAGRESPELRRVSPMLLERRAARHYLLAYCHNRRANRTFRVDRLELVDEDGGAEMGEPSGKDSQ
jgi:hypothetical protein